MINQEPRSAVEMPGRGKPGKPKPGFPAFPPALGNRNCDSHIPTAPTVCYLSSERTKNNPAKGARHCARLTFILQAHSRIRKCYELEAA
jgi:hypothetical protein